MESSGKIETIPEQLVLAKGLNDQFNRFPAMKRIMTSVADGLITIIHCKRSSEVPVQASTEPKAMYHIRLGSNCGTKSVDIGVDDSLNAIAGEFREEGEEPIVFDRKNQQLGRQLEVELIIQVAVSQLLDSIK
jgi:hypothetical protein